MLKKKIQLILILWNLSLLLLVLIIAIFIFHSADFVYPTISPLIIISIIYFLFLCSLSIKNRALLFFSLPLCLITVPNAINDINIGYMMGPVWEFNTSSFSFFTHIDIFLWLSIIRYSEKIKNFLRNDIIIIAIVFFCIQIATNLINYINSDYLGSYLTGMYQVRYLFLLIMVTGIYRHDVHFKHLYFGVLFSSIILIVESLVTTYLVGSGSRLTSGNFGINVYGNFLAAIAIFLYMGEKILFINLFQKIIIFISIILIAIAILMTGTRGAIISFLISIILSFIFVKKNNSSFILQFSKKLLIASVAIIMVIQIIQYLNEFSSQEINNDSYVYSEESSSLRARYLMSEMSISMIEDNYLFGVGNSIWNRLKYEYNTPFSILLDPHNDYLNYIVSYGVLLGSCIIFFIYIYPLYITFTRNHFALKNIHPFSLFILTISISSISNSNTAKHQVFAFSILFCFILYQILQTKPEKNQSTTSSNL